MRQCIPRSGCLGIAQQIAKKTFRIDIDKNVVTRVLAAHYRPVSDDDGPSWLTLLGHTKDGLWSTDLFRCESILLKVHWVLVVMDQITRRIIGVGIHAGDVDGAGLRRMFNIAISSQGAPHHLCSGNDPIFRYHRWQANLWILGIDEIWAIPYTPVSHPFVERLIGTIRREYLDRIFFWNAQDLERKLATFLQYYNKKRVHQSLDGDAPAEASGEHQPLAAKLGTLHGYRIATDFFRPRSLHEQEFAKDRLNQQILLPGGHCF